MNIPSYINHAIISSGCPPSGRHLNYTISSPHFTQNLFINVPKFPDHLQLVLPITFALSIKDAITCLSYSSRCRYSRIRKASQYFLCPASSTISRASASDTATDSSCLLASSALFLSTKCSLD